MTSSSSERTGLLFLRVWIEPGGGTNAVRARVTATVGGSVRGEGTSPDRRLYQLVRQPLAVDERTFQITFLEPGVEACVFTSAKPGGALALKHRRTVRWSRRPAEEPYLEGHNTWCVNVPGSLLVIPVADMPSTSSPSSAP
jgi:hypothetical protein